MGGASDSLGERSTCSGCHLCVERLEDGIAIYPLGSLPKHSLWADAIYERVRSLTGGWGAGNVHLDCATAQYIGSEGLGKLVSVYRLIRQQGGRLLLHGLNDDICEILRICKLDSVFSIRSDKMPGNTPRRLDPSLLAWNGGTILQIAQAIDNEFTREGQTSGASSRGRVCQGMPILADALEDAGCTDAEILSHLRGAGPHIRDCWILGLILGKR